MKRHRPYKLHGYTTVELMITIFMVVWFGLVLTGVITVFTLAWTLIAHFW